MKHNIDLLLEKYWEGTSTLEDENQLKTYFLQENIDETHIPYKDLFGWMGQASQVQSPLEVDMNLLLDKYWEGNTSLKEESLLKAYFNSGQIAENHQQFAEMFAFFDHEAQITYQGSNIIEPNAPTEVKVMRLNIKKWIYAAAAASVLVIGAIFVVNNMKPESNTNKYANIHEIEDPEEALRVTKEALALVSKKFRKSQLSVRENMGALEKASLFK